MRHFSVKSRENISCHSLCPSQRPGIVSLLSSSSSPAADRRDSENLPKDKTKKKKKSGVLLKDLWKHSQQWNDKHQQQPKGKKKRTRKRVENPQQVYVYASQRRQLQAQEKKNDKDDDEEEEDNEKDDEDGEIHPQKMESWVSKVKREYGFIASTQQCEPDIRMPHQDKADIEAAASWIDSNHIVVPQMEMACPQFLRQIRIGPGTDPNQDYAYVLTKPPGWSILGGGGGGNAKTQILPKFLSSQGDLGDKSLENDAEEEKEEEESVMETDSREGVDEGSTEIFEDATIGDDDESFSKADQTAFDGSEDGDRWIMELEDGEEEEVNAQDLSKQMTDEELLEFMSPDDVAFLRQQEEEDLKEESNSVPGNEKDLVGEQDNDVLFQPSQVLQWLTSQEIAELEQEGGLEALQLTPADAAAARAAEQAVREGCDEGTIAARAEEARRTATTTMRPSLKDTSVGNDSAAQTSASAAAALTTATGSRPSLVTWFKNHQLVENDISIKAGRHWKAVGGATQVDDSGLVLLRPRSWDKNQIQKNLFVDYIRYVAIVGNGGFLAKVTTGSRSSLSPENVKVQVTSRLRKGRTSGTVNDAVQTLQVTAVDGLSTCGDDIVGLCQDFAADGIRGDVQAHPLDPRASRRLLHCSEMSLSSLSHPDGAILELSVAPDDVRLWSSRQQPLVEGSSQDKEVQYSKWTGGSFLGRRELQQNPITTAYREINGAGDGYPGWIVDRYDKWLLVQRQQDAAQDDGSNAVRDWKQGPLPPLQEGVTEGIYCFTSVPDRSRLSASSSSSSPASPSSPTKPVLMEGRAIPPDGIPVLENGITYLVDFSHLSTGLFLDQRLQRAWLARYCTSETRVLNCFAHCGAFSVAAATAGASTVSVDLDQKWLNRIEPQLRANGITDTSRSRHDCIYGDCFDWLVRLGKRGELFDVVILDPPSTSVGGRKKKRWSLQNDMDELVALAATLVKPNGLLWTTTNSASISSERFAKLCSKGLQRSGRGQGVKLERVAPMPLDFPSVGPHPVTNLVWRLA